MYHVQLDLSSKEVKQLKVLAAASGLRNNQFTTKLVKAGLVKEAKRVKKEEVIV